VATHLRIGDTFPDLELPNTRSEPVRLSQLTRPSLLDEHLGFHDGYPLILVFCRGFFAHATSSNSASSRMPIVPSRTPSCCAQT
jgi:hypothetical protein